MLQRSTVRSWVSWDVVGCNAASSAVRSHISQGITRLVENRVRVCHRSTISNFQEPALVIPSWLKLLLRKIIAKHLQKKQMSRWIHRDISKFQIWKPLTRERMFPFPSLKFLLHTRRPPCGHNHQHVPTPELAPCHGQHHKARPIMTVLQGIMDPPRLARNPCCFNIFWHKENNGNSPRSEWNKKRTNPRICWMNTSWAPFYARIWSFDRFADLWGACAECGFCWIYFHWVSQSW